MATQAWDLLSPILADAKRTLGLGQLYGQLGWIAVLGFPIYNFFALRFGNGTLYSRFEVPTEQTQSSPKRSSFFALKNAFDQNFFRPVLSNQDLKILLFLVLISAVGHQIFDLLPLISKASQSISNFLNQVFGEPNSRSSFGWKGELLFTLCFAISMDFAYYLQHRLLHEFEPFWAFHKVHHSAKRLSPWTTCFRIHLVEDLIVSITMGSCGAIVIAAFAHFSAPVPQQLMVTGISLYAAAKALQNSVLHNHVWTS